MPERGEAAPNNPIQTVARLISIAKREEAYIEQQDIYPMQSQRAALILPAIKEDIERRLGLMSQYDRETAEKMAELMGKLPEGYEETETGHSFTGEMPDREDMREELNRIANEEFKEEGES